MNRHTTIRTLAGISIIGFGFLALLGSLGTIDFGMLFRTWWPLILIWVGLLNFLSNPKEFGWSAILMLSGLLLQLRELDLLNFNIWHLIWPVAIIIVGFSIIFNRSRSKIRTSTDKTGSTNAFMSGYTAKNQSKDYQGGSATAIMGGIKLDLTQATITKEATLEVFTIMGGVEVMVPKDWTVDVRITPIMGSVENYTDNIREDNTPKLIVVGEAIMGGVEIKRR